MERGRERERERERERDEEIESLARCTSSYLKLDT
jgi:hypothetical protein